MSLVLMVFARGSYARETPLSVLVIGAHPDDCDSCAGGTAIQWASMGHRVKFLSLTNGDAGHQSEGGGALAKRRRAEAEEAGRRLGIAEYEVLDNHDGELEPTLPVRGQVIRAIRSWNADLVVLPRPNDYHPDHRNTGLVVQDAAYMVIVPNVAPDTPPLSRNPVFLYCQDSFQRPNPFRPDVAVDITSVYEKKVEALDAHVSQFYEWLPWTAGKLAEVPAGKEERKRWLSATRERSIPPEVRAALERGYGAERAGQSVHAEAFEICEYGSRPGAAELRRLFPMVPGAGR
jgi:LmbE family N-acetylglucosaminyl deacetylase